MHRFVIVCLLMLAAAPAGAVKPRAPVALAWEALSATDGGVRLALHLESALAGPVEIVVTPPPGARVRSGALRWRGEVRPGRQTPLTLSLDYGDAAPGAPLRAHARFGGGGVVSGAQAVYRLPARVVGVVPRAAPGAGPRLRQYRGRPVVEYPARP